MFDYILRVFRHVKIIIKKSVGEQTAVFKALFIVYIVVYDSLCTIGRYIKQYILLMLV